MKPFLVCALSVVTLSSIARAQDMIVWLQDPSGSDTINIASIGGTGTIQLWMNVNSGTRLLGLDVFLSAYDGGFSQQVNFDVTGFNDQTIPGGMMQRQTRGNVEDDVASLGFGDLSDYHYASSDPVTPVNGSSGYLGTGTDVLLDEIIITGTSSTGGFGPDFVIFGPIPSELPAASQVVWSGSAWNVTDAVVDMGTGSWINVRSGGLNPLYVNVAPEPASLALLAIGGFAALRRRR